METKPRPENDEVVTPPKPTRPIDQTQELSDWVEATLPRALAYATSQVGRRSEAEDLVQDCYARLFARRHEYDLPKEGIKLLFRSITNACINWHQRHRPAASLDQLRAEALEPQTLPFGEADPVSQAMHLELQDAVGRALAELPVLQRAVIELRSMGYAVNEIAEMLDLTAGNARVILHRARQSLGAQLRPFLDEPKEDR